MNDGTPDQRSTLASYKMAKNDTTDSDESEKTLKAEGRARALSYDMTAAARTSSPNKNDSDSLGKQPKAASLKGPKQGPSEAMAEILKAAAAKEYDVDFDMSMVPMTFPQRLHELLSNDEHEDVISWLTSGDGFTIHNKHRFSTEVMPKYFKESKFSSFTRKLNRWGFQRVGKGPDQGAYYHEHFLRDNLRRTLLMQCANRSGASKNKRQFGGIGSIRTRQPQISEADQIAVLGQIRGLEQLLQQRDEQKAAAEHVERARIEALLRQQGQQADSNVASDPVGAALNQYQKLLAQVGRSSSGSNQSADAQQALLAQLQAASSSPAGLRSSLVAAPAATSDLRPSAAAAPFPQRLPDSSLSTAEHQAYVLEAANALRRSDPAAYMAVLAAAKEKAANRVHLASAQEEERYRAALLQAQREKQLSDLLAAQRASNLPPKKR